MRKCPHSRRHAASWASRSLEKPQCALESSARAPSSGEATATSREVAIATVLSTTPSSEAHTSELPSLMRTSYAVFCLQKKPTTAPLRIHNRQSVSNDLRTQAYTDYTTAISLE